MFHLSQVHSTTLTFEGLLLPVVSTMSKDASSSSTKAISILPASVVKSSPCSSRSSPSSPSIDSVVGYAQVIVEIIVRFTFCQAPNGTCHNKKSFIFPAKIANRTFEIFRRRGPNAGSKRYVLQYPRRQLMLF